jgi:hypothetical protein
MSEEEKMKIADAADMIVNGYAFEKKAGNITVVNLNRSVPHVMVMDASGKMLESSMDPIEQRIVLEIWKKDKEYMEETYA